MNIVATLSVWLLPVLIAITFHEAAHAYIARAFGDETAARQGRVTLNPVSHIDPTGTILLPGLLLLAHSPFMFGYARPVPVNFGALKHRRLGMISVAAAGPATNIGLAILAALANHFLPYLPQHAVIWVAHNLRNALVVNVVLAVFNLLPLLPLDGGRILLALLPQKIARPYSRLEPFGIFILVGLLIVLPLFGPQPGMDLSVFSHFIATVTTSVLQFILVLTANA